MIDANYRSGYKRRASIRAGPTEANATWRQDRHTRCPGLDRYIPRKSRITKTIRVYERAHKRERRHRMGSRAVSVAFQNRSDFQHTAQQAERVYLAMPKGPKGEKRPADVIGNAVKVMRIATGEEEETLADEGKNAAAVALGRKGGLARTKATTPERRKE